MSYNEEQQSLNQKIREELALLREVQTDLRRRIYAGPPQKAYVAKYRLYKILNQTVVGANPFIKNYNAARIFLATASAQFVAENIKGVKHTKEVSISTSLDAITVKTVRDLLYERFPQEIAERFTDKELSLWEHGEPTISYEYPQEQSLIGLAREYSSINTLLEAALSIDYASLTEDYDPREDEDILRQYTASPVAPSWMRLFSFVEPLATNYDLPDYYPMDKHLFIPGNNSELLNELKHRKELLHIIHTFRLGFERALEEELFTEITVKDLAAAKDIGLVLSSDELIEALSTRSSKLPELTFKEREEIIKQLSEDKFFQEIKFPVANFIANDFTNKDSRLEGPPTPNVSFLKGLVVAPNLSRKLNITSLDIESVGYTAYLAQVSSNSFTVGNTKVSNSVEKNYYIKSNDFSVYDEDAAKFLLDTQDPEGGIVTTKLRHLLSEDISTEQIIKRMKSWSFSAVHKISSAEDYFSTKNKGKATLDSVRGELLHKAITNRLTEYEIREAVKPHIADEHVLEEYVTVLKQVADGIPEQVSEELQKYGLPSVSKIDPSNFEKDFSVKVKSTTFTGRIDLYLPEDNTVIDFKSTRSIKPYIKNSPQVKWYGAALNRGRRKTSPKVTRVGYFKLPSINLINDKIVVVDDTVSLTFTPMDGAAEELEATAKTVEFFNAVGKITTDARKKGITASYITKGNPSTNNNKLLFKDKNTRLKEFFKKMEKKGNKVVPEDTQHDAIVDVLTVGGNQIYAGHNINYDILRLALAERNLPLAKRRVLLTAGTTNRVRAFFDKSTYGDETKSKAYGYADDETVEMASNEAYIKYLDRGISFEEKVEEPIGVIRKEFNQVAKVIDTISISQSALFKAFTLAYFVEEGHQSDTHYSTKTLRKLRENVLSDEHIKWLGGDQKYQKDYLLYFLSGEGTLNRKNTLINALTYGLYSTGNTGSIDYGYSQEDMYRILYGKDPPKGLHNSLVDVAVNRDILLYFLGKRYLSNNSPVASFLGSLIHDAIVDYARSSEHPASYTFERALLQKSSAAVKLLLDSIDNKAAASTIENTLSEYKGTISVDPKTSGVDKNIVKNVVHLLRDKQWYQNKVDITVKRSATKSQKVIDSVVKLVTELLHKRTTEQNKKTEVHIKRRTHVTTEENRQEELFKKTAEATNLVDAIVTKQGFTTIKAFLKQNLVTGSTYKYRHMVNLKNAMLNGTLNDVMSTPAADSIRDLIIKAYAGKTQPPDDTIDYMVEEMMEHVWDVIELDTPEEKLKAVQAEYTRRLYAKSSSDEFKKTMSRDHTRKAVMSRIEPLIASGTHTVGDILNLVAKHQDAVFQTITSASTKRINAAQDAQDKNAKKLAAKTTADENKHKAANRNTFIKGLSTLLEFATNGGREFAPGDVSIFTNPIAKSEDLKNASNRLIASLKQGGLSEEVVSFVTDMTKNPYDFFGDKWAGTEKQLLGFLKEAAHKQFAGQLPVLGFIGDTKTVETFNDVLSTRTDYMKKREEAALTKALAKDDLIKEIEAYYSPYTQYSDDYTYADDNPEIARLNNILAKHNATRSTLNRMDIGTLKDISHAIGLNNMDADYLERNPVVAENIDPALRQAIMTGNKWMPLAKINDEMDTFVLDQAAAKDKDILQKTLAQSKMRDILNDVLPYLPSEERRQEARTRADEYVEANYTSSPAEFRSGVPTAFKDILQEGHFWNFVQTHPQYEKHVDEMMQGLSSRAITTKEDVSTYLSNFCRDLDKTSDKLQNFANTLTKVSAFQLEKVMQTKYTALSGIADAASNGILPSSLVSSVARIQQSSLQEMHSKNQWIYSMQEGIDAAQPLLSAATAGLLANPVTMPAGVGLAAVQGLYSIGTQAYGIMKTKGIKENSLNIQSALNKINGAFALGAGILMDGFKLVKGVLGTGAAVLNKSFSLLRTGAIAAVGAGVAGAYMIDRSINGQRGLALSVSPMTGESDKTGFFRNIAEAAAVDFNYQSLASISSSRELLFATGSLDMGKLISLALLGEQNIMLGQNTDMNAWWKKKINDVRGKKITSRDIALYNSVIPGIGDALYQYSLLNPEAPDWFSKENSKRKPLSAEDAALYRYYANAWAYTKEGFPELGQRLSHSFLKNGGLQDLNLVLGEATNISTVLESMVASAMNGNISGVISGGKDLWAGVRDSVVKIKNESVLLDSVQKLTSKGVRDYMWQQVKQNAPATWDTIKKYGSDFKHGVMDWWTNNNVGAKLQGWADTGMKWIASAVDRGMPYFQEGASRFIDTAHKFFTSNKDDIVGTANKIAEGILDVISSKKEKLTDIADILAAATIGVFTKNKDRMAELGVEIGNSFYSIAQKWLGDVEDLLSRVRFNVWTGKFSIDPEKSSKVDSISYTGEVDLNLVKDLMYTGQVSGKTDIIIKFVDEKGNTIGEYSFDRAKSGTTQTYTYYRDKGLLELNNGSGGSK